jgi:DNA-binding Xre family transcriptional regulator
LTPLRPWGVAPNPTLKKDLQATAGISPSSISKLSKNEYVSMDVLVKVCTALGVDFKDIMELVPNMVEERE